MANISQKLKFSEKKKATLRLAQGDNEVFYSSSTEGEFFGAKTVHRMKRPPFEFLRMAGGSQALVILKPTRRTTRIRYKKEATRGRTSGFDAGERLTSVLARG